MAGIQFPTDDYRRRDGKWYWLDYECKGADVASFAPHSNVWATDCKGLFKQHSRVRVADPAHIRILNLLFATDGQQIYYIMGVAKDVADVSTFEVLDPGFYICPDGHERRFGFARDSQNVYLHDFFSGKPKVLKGTDRNKFKRLEYGFATDGRSVWIESQRIKHCDPATFEIINNLYSKDKHRVYYLETALPGANPVTFRLLGEFTATDDCDVYLQRDLITGADPMTYVVDSQSPYDGRDAFRSYSHGKAV